MNKITKRIVAGVSALALLASAVGVDQLADLFMKTSYAEGCKGKNALSTGFSNLEQDTNKDGYYNTGYGLHTNKTVTNVGDDGRTFDVNLESWYVGENPVDVATILDASGSMAWTVNTLDPMEVDAQISEDDKKYLKSKYKTDSLAEIQTDNGGYLPQDVVDLILDPENTDNTKLSYAGYKYYVYEDRSSVSEFVPLGYWDGGVDPKNDDSLIGYYPFSGDLKNKAPSKVDDENAKGMLINHPTGSESTYNTSEKAAIKAEAVFSTDTYEKKKGEKPVTEDKGLDIRKTAPIGGVLLDSPKTDKFTIKMKFSEGHLVDKSNEDQYGDTTFLYITDGENYYKFYRRKGSSRNRMGVDTPTKTQFLNINNVFNASNEQEWTFEFDFTTNKLNLTTDDTDIVWTGTTTGKEYSVDLTTTLDTSNLQVILGYTDKPEEIEKFSDVYVKSVEISDDATTVANYEFSVDTKSLQNSVNNTDATFVQQGDHTQSIETVYLDPVIIEKKYLDLNATAKLGAVMIDAVPDINSEKGFTISMKLQKSGGLNKDSSKGAADKQNIFYLGDKNSSSNKYYQFFRSAQNGGYLVLSKDQKDELGSEDTYYQGGLRSNNEWYTNTLVFEPVGDGKVKVTPYINGKSYEENADAFQSNKPNTPEIEPIVVESKDLVFLLGALQSNSSGSEHYIDDLYIFDEALDAEVVNAYFGDNTVSCDVDDATHALSYVKDAKGDFEKDEDGNLKTIEIAQISNGEKRLGQNTNIDQRRGWYYVNSASNWADIAGCLASGKQYIGIFTDDGLDGSFKDMAKDIATIPTGFAEGDSKLQEIATEISAGDTSETKYKAPSTERSIRFYVDTANHLRCFVWSGDTTKSADNERTFCSVVFEKIGDQLTKYEELNNALNSFYSTLAENSDLSNSAIVRFSTNNAVDKDHPTTTDTNLKKLIMKDWINWSDAYLKESNKDKTTYLQNLLIPETDDENATYTTQSTARGDEILEYPYVMTGGTYTWTGLKAFYDNMVKKDGLSSGDRVYDVANDARDKYLIIFTDGRDNTQDYDVSSTVSEALGTELAGTPDYKTGSAFLKKDYVGTYNPYADTSHKVGFSIENYNNHDYNNRGDYEEYPKTVQQFKTENHEIATDGDLAEAWADKLKDEGYTIYCVMLATGSISEYTNKAEYNKAYNFMKSLAGSNEIDEEIAEKQAEMKGMLDNNTKPDEIAELQEEMEALKDNKVIVVDQNQGAGGVTKAFQQILEQIQQPREDYNVQDYIDPRFDLVDKDGNLYHLGAGGKITVTDSNGDAVTQYTTREGSHTYTYHDKPNTITVGNIIEPKEGETTVGLAYTPRDSYMVNRIKDTYDTDPKNVGKYNNGDGSGTGYIYYDDEKDMYYLRWEDQVIPMEDEAFDTTKGNEHYLNVWSATIRLKAKDDFIGGNNILTNGNEAGENLVYSDATIENMDKNPKLYFSDTKTSHTLREKLKVLSGTDRKINAVDADGVSQAVYGDGIDIPSSGFPRTTVNVRLLKLDAKNLNDVIYMGEVVSPTMMLSDLENDYMTGSYYLEYLERYAYRLYGKDTDKTPLLDLLNEWLKIDDKDEMSKTFTIPYIYLPAPIYKNGKLQVDKATNKVIVSNNTGASWDTSDNTNFDDLNLRDVTGFITYTWKRDDGGEKQQEIKDKPGEYDITKDYVVKNTEQIEYNLQLKFTPLKEGDLPSDFVFDKIFITAKDGETGDKFFKINAATKEFEAATETDGWSIDYNREDYLQAMISEKHTYEPHVIYDTTHGKWVLVDDKEGSTHTTTAALAQYKGDDDQISTDSAAKTLTDSGVYDWDKEYKPVAGIEQIEGDKLTDYYTSTPHNVGMADKDGVTITKENGDFKDGYGKDDVYSLVANTTYTKDVVNAALALEIYVDGKYLQSGMPMAKRNTFTFEATRYYDDPLDPLPYGDDIDADTGTVSSSGNVGGKKYRLTFSYDIPSDATPSEIYRLWAKLTKVEVEQADGTYKSITADGYDVENALPIGTYEISVSDTDMAKDDKTSQYYLGTAVGELSPGHFKYLKIENDVNSYTYERFPETVSGVSKDAVTDTGDKEYQIWNGKSDYSKANIAKNNRVKDGTNQTVTFYFGTVAEKKDGTTTLKNTKGVSVKEYLKEHPEDTKLEKFTNDYAKDRLGIIMLSASANSLAISKEVTKTNTSTASYKAADWDFTVTVKTKDSEWADSHESGAEIDYTLYNLEGKEWVADTAVHKANLEIIAPAAGSDEYTLTINIKVKHNQKAVLSGLPEGTWQVTEVEKTNVLYTPHNDQSEFSEDLWLYNKADTTREIELSPASQVNYVNEFPHELPSTGGSGIVRLIFLGSAFTLCSVMLFAILWYNCRKRRTMKK